MEPFERYYKIGQNADSDLALQFNYRELTHEERVYFGQLSAHLKKTGLPMAGTPEGINLMVAAFTSGVGYAGANFSERRK